jgi:hypothetical protein
MQGSIKPSISQAQWFMSIIPDTWEAEIVETEVQGQPGKKLGRPYVKH